jgi:hypothetical protein
VPDLEQDEEDERDEERNKSRGVDRDLKRCGFSTVLHWRSDVYAYDVLSVLLEFRNVEGSVYPAPPVRTALSTTNGVCESGRR